MRIIAFNSFSEHSITQQYIRHLRHATLVYLQGSSSSSDCSKVTYAGGIGFSQGQGFNTLEGV